MSHTVMWVTMGSVFLGFLLFSGAFLSHMYQRSPKLTWGLFGVAVVFITVIPVVLAVGVSAR